MSMAIHHEGHSQNSPAVPLPRQSAAAHAARGAQAERERVRKALHDGLGQLLTSISFLAGSLKTKLAALDLPEAGDAEDIMALTKQAINETQALIHEGKPPPRG